MSTTEERFWSKVDVGRDSECWSWTAYKRADGYGTFGVGGRSGGKVYAHRWAWESVNGPIPDGLTIDHLCANPSCVNPSHLEAVTNAENVRRARPAAFSASRSPVCRNGHTWTPETSYLRPDGVLRCRACHRAAAARYRASSLPEAS